MTRHDRAKALEALIDSYGINNVLQAVADVCGHKARFNAEVAMNLPKAKAWAEWAECLDHVVKGSVEV
jgi:hypothetical protein